MVKKVCSNWYFYLHWCLYSYNIVEFISGKLERFEIPTGIILCTDVWTPDNNLVTAAFKLKRKEIYNKYKIAIDKLYQSWYHLLKCIIY